MSDSDKKPPGGGGKAPLDDFDWDAALAEWDKQPFSPEVAGDKKDKPAGAPSKPLYRPPMKTTDPASSQIAAPPPPRPVAPKAPPPPPPARRRGGLGPLFSRPDMRKVGEEDSGIDVLLEEPMARKRFRAEDDDEGVVTSAVDVETTVGDIEEALQAAAEQPALDEVPEGEMFDPFSEPRVKDAPTVYPPPMEPPRSAQQTSPALDEILPDAAVPSSAPVAAPPPPAPTMEVTEVSESPRGQSFSSEVEEVHEFEPPKLPSLAPPIVSEIDDEKPAALWLDEETIGSLRERAIWLEQEARNVVDKVGSAKSLLAVSELRAIVGDVDEARQLAEEAKSLAGHLPLAHRQWRGLGSRDAGEIVDSLDDELRHAPAPAAKLHATLYAAEALAASGDADGATKRFDGATRLAPSDARAVLARALRALVKGELTNAALRLPDDPQLVGLSTALSAALRARGVEAHDGEAGAGALDTLGRARASLEKGDVAGAVDRLGELAATQPGADGTEPSSPVGRDGSPRRLLRCERRRVGALRSCSTPSPKAETSSRRERSLPAPSSLATRTWRGVRSAPAVRSPRRTASRFRPSLESRANATSTTRRR